MQFPPFLNVGKGAWWKGAPYDPGFDFDRNFQIPVRRVKVGGSVIVVVHGDDDSKKSAQLRHAINLRPPTASVQLSRGQRFEGPALGKARETRRIKSEQSALDFHGTGSPLRARRVASGP
jgi:hypothetical protein